MVLPMVSLLAMHWESQSGTLLAGKLVLPLATLKAKLLARQSVLPSAVNLVRLLVVLMEPPSAMPWELQ